MMCSTAKTERRKPGGRQTHHFGLCMVVGLCLVLAGCSRPPAVTPVTSLTVISADEPLRSASELLAGASDLDTCRNALQQINTHLDLKAEQGASPFTTQQREWLQQQFRLDEEDLAEVESKSYTSLDGHHLHFCLLLRDAARYLDLEDMPPLEKAATAFTWVVRQCRLVERNTPLVPPEFTLRRGWGTAQDRALLFLAFLDYLGLDGCMLGFPFGRNGERTLLWTCGVLIGPDLFLFDPRLGMPLPGPGEQGIATLAHVQSKPDVLGQLTFEADRLAEVMLQSWASYCGAFLGAPFGASLQSLAVARVILFPGYDVTPELSRRAVVLHTCSLSAIAPRWRRLEEMRTPRQEPLVDLAGGRLYVDPFERARRFQAAAVDQASKQKVVLVWADAVLSLRRFFLPAVSGDAGTVGNRPLSFRAQFELSLVPWEATPKLLRELLPFSAHKFRPQRVNSRLFLPFWPEKRESREVETALQDPAGVEMLEFFARPCTQFVLGPRLPRDRHLRGRSREAIPTLVETVEVLREQRQRFQAIPDLESKVAQWHNRLLAAHRNLQSLQGDTGKEKQLEAAQMQLLLVRLEGLESPENFVLAVWRQGLQEAQRDRQERQKTLKAANLPGDGPKVATIFLEGCTAQPLGEAARYLLSLCLHEEALRQERRMNRVRCRGLPVPAHQEKKAYEAWKDAARSWETFALEYPSAAAAAAARLHHAQARQALNELPRALELLEDLSGNLTHLEKTARLYQARLIRQTMKPAVP